MEQQQVAEASPLDVKTAQSATPMEPQTEPQVETDDASNKNKKKKKKKKSRRKSLERTQSEVEEMQNKQAEDKPEEEGEENETNQKQDEAFTEKTTVTEEAPIEETSTVTEETSTEETTVAEETSTEETTVAEETLTERTTVKEEKTTEGTTVAEEASVEKTTVTKEEKEELHVDEAEVSGDELGPPSLERQSSLDSFKVTGTRAVGSLFSRFKVGRKKPATKSEVANPSPVKTEMKRLEVPKEKNLDDLPTWTKTDFSGEGEQSIHVSAEDKHEAMEKLKTSEKEVEEAVKAASASKQTSPSSSNKDLLAQIDSAQDEEEHLASSALVEESVEAEVSEIKMTSVSTDSGTVESAASESSEAVVDNIAVPEQEVEEVAKTKQTPPSSTNEDLLAQIDSAKEKEGDVTNSAFVGESTEAEVSEIKLTSVSAESGTVELSEEAASESFVAVVDKIAEPEHVASESSEAVVDKIAEPEQAAPVVEPSVLEVAVSVATIDTVGDNVNISATELAADTMVEIEQQITDVTTILPASLKLDLDLDSNTETTKSAHEEVGEELVDTTEASLDAVASNKIVLEEAPLIEETDVLPVKVAPPTPELAAEGPSPTVPEKMSPVKSLASRFEGKREQSLDSLKFRTVREFFTEERSVRVGAEKKKYEALTEQQKLKDEAEEEAKSKYNSFKSPAKERDVHATVTAHKDIAIPVAPAAEIVNATSAEAHNFSTPETVATRKKFSFDEGYAATNSPAQFNGDAPEAVTPVKSIASRFEGKREQSLDSLKFRTVREFFPSESKRSVHVGAEKAKFEALTKQQDEAAKTAQQIKLKHAVPAPPAMKIESHDAIPVSDVTLDNSAAVVELDSTTRALETNAAEITVSVEESAPAEPVTDEIESSINEDEDPSQFKESDGINTALTSNADESVSSKDIQTNTLGDTEDVVSIEPVVADDDKQGNYVSACNTEVPAEAAEPKIEQGVTQESEQAVENETDQELEHEVDPQPQEEVQQEITQEIEQKTEKRAGGEIKLDDMNVDEPMVETLVESISDAFPVSIDFNEQATVNTVLVEQESVEIVEQLVDGEVADGLVELDLGDPVKGEQVKHAVRAVSDIIDASAESQDVDTQLDKDQGYAMESQLEAVESIQSPDNGLVELDLGESITEKPLVDSSQQAKSKSRPMLTTERSFVMENDDTIETEDTVVVGERPMTDGEDEFELLSPTKARPAHELFARIPSSSTRKSSTSAKKKMVKSSNSSKTPPKLTRKVSVGSTGSAKSAKSSTVPVPMRRASITAPTASSMAKKAAEADEMHWSSPQLKKQGSASKLMGTVNDTGFIKPPPAAPTVPVPMKRASITAPTASYMAKKAAEAEKTHRASPQPKQNRSTSKQKGTVSETGFIKPPPAAPTVPAPMKRASITAPTASSQARHIPDHTREENAPRPASKTRSSKVKGTVGPTGFVKPIPPPSTVPVAPKRASIMAPTASYMAKKAAENAEESSVTFSSVPSRNKRYSNVKSKVLEGIGSGLTHAVTHKTITKEEFIAAERRKSLGSAGVRSVLDSVDRRASLTARVAIDCPPEPFVRSAFSRKKLESTVPRYMNYENAPGYAERARQQYERRKRLEEENAAKSEKRQRELRMHFAEKQQKALLSSAEEVRRGLEAHEFTRLAKESEVAVQNNMRKEKQRALSMRNQHRASSTTSGSSSNGFASRASKKSSVSSVEDKVVAVAAVELTVLETDEELVESSTVNTVEPLEEVTTEVQEVVVEAAQVEEQTIPVPLVDENPALEHVAKKIDFDDASSDSDEEDVSNQ